MRSPVCLRLAAVALVWISAMPAAAQETPGGKGLNATEYEGWRQYNVHCARCHGQDALPNPVAPNLLESLAPGGPAADEGAFTTIVMAGRPQRGMPGFKKTVEPIQVAAMYAYLKGRAEKRIPPGRPKRPAS
jgi:mono/diheme cytochrome c family protein